jgi:hypothetical protein
MFQQIDPEEVKRNMEQAQRESSKPSAKRWWSSFIMVWGIIFIIISIAGFGMMLDSIPELGAAIALEATEYPIFVFILGLVLIRVSKRLRTNNMKKLPMENTEANSDERISR